MLATTFITLLSALPLMASAQSSEARAPVLSFIHPPGRGSAFETASMDPCGGYELGGRLEYPITGGDISLAVSRDARDLTYAYSTSSDPQAASDFTAFSKTDQVPFSGSSCFDAPDFTGSGLEVGQNVTLQLSWNAGPRASKGYMCADLILVEPATFESLNRNYTCSNTYRSTQTRSSANPSLGSIQAAAAASSAAAHAQAYAEAFWQYAPGGLSLAGAGGIGAGVTLGVVGLVLLLGWMSGAVVFGKRKTRQMGDDEDRIMRETKSISSSV